MQKQGLECSDFDKAYQKLIHLDRNHASSHKALQEFLEIYKAPKVCYEVGVHKIYNKPESFQSIKPLDGAIEILNELANEHDLALVTRGIESIQKEKMRCAKIPIKLFKSLYFCEKGPLSNQGKKEFYQILGEKFPISPSQILVCGDRISIDLAPAKELGYTTVQMKWGRGLGNTGLKKDVDYTILHLNEIKPIIQEIKSMELAWR